MFFVALSNLYNESNAQTMTLENQKDFILRMYTDLFQNTDVDKIPTYCASNFKKDNNYDVSDYDDFVAHIKDLQTKEKVTFHIEFIINVPGQVLIRTLVYKADQIKGAAPISLLMSYWQFNDAGLIDYCKEVESSS